METAFSIDIPQRLEETCNPTQTALIVCGMQVGIISQLPKGQEVVERVNTVLESARKGNYRVFFMRHMSLPNEAAGMFQLRTAMAWQRVQTVEEVHPWFLRDTPGFEIVPELVPLPSEVVFDKLTMSVFEGTPLNIALRDCNINSFIVVGVATELGIEPTVRHGADLGYIPIVVKDACGGGNEAAAERSFEAMEFIGDAMLTDIQTICQIMES